MAKNLLIEGTDTQFVLQILEILHQYQWMKDTTVSIT